MRRLLEGVDVVVIRHVPTGRADAMGDEVATEEAETVSDVLVAPQSSADADDATRPNGDVDAIRLHFPKSYAKPLAGCDIEVGGLRYRVQGDPRGYLPHLTPGRWNRPVTARRVEG